MSDVKLLVKACSHEAAKYAVLHWHYSKSMPVGKLVKYGAWENDQFIGAVIFSRGANNRLGDPYDLKQIEVCELTRVALKETHGSPVSKIVSYCVKLLQKSSPGLRLIVSYADTAQNHIGGIYQSMNWIYVGLMKTAPYHFVNGRWMHQKSVHSLYGTICFPHEQKPGSDKHKYLYPLDKAMRRQIEPLAKPYPKRASEVNGDTIGDQPIEGGSTPTQTLTLQRAADMGLTPNLLSES